MQLMQLVDRMQGMTALATIGTLDAPVAPGAWFYDGGTVAERDWMRPAEVADLFGVDRSTVYRLSKEQLDYWLTPGGQRRYRKVDVVRYGREVMGLKISGPDQPGS